ncbi:DNA cytosine methyltransferase [Bacillus paralicheniformis]|uniref:DNA cytosine methyltransferase n=1 Tax=Bacillus paralicheniformis TaxID=1648923 RepID=UPI0021F49691|nr:DNA cytosine methyltransferase [Bacillus paralicheniformis]MCV9371110.1 DNA cytosine methyltransferase [Bacillus paralicheniformis]WIG10012.1 DNA cytosine methyltransferase [Bacillus paralicheniformis]
MTNIPNHYGYGLRNDEKPYAHKIPDGGNWRSLPEEERKAFMKGAFYSGGGQTTYLRKMSWDEPALTITASVMAKATCHLHPNKPIERSEYMGDFNLTPQQPANGLTVLELFCGGGLGAIGFKAAGYDIVKALDFDKNAVKAYHHNFGDHVEQADITEIDIDSLPNTDVIFGGPPCQDFSIAGKGAGADGERGKLVWRYLEIIAAKQPKAFVFENVKGLISKRHRPTFDALIEKFNEIGYEISWRVMSAWDYGVAQKRERVFIVGIRKDLGFTFEFPNPLEGDYQTRVLRDVIGDLPETIENHHPKPLSVRVRSRMNSGGYETYFKKHPMGQLKLPGYTITSHYAKGAPDGLVDIKPEPRRFTVRECLRIQSAPDNYVLPDDISLSAQYRIVGNGIASRVAWYVGRALADQLSSN